jgi:hypothetical protein
MHLRAGKILFSQASLPNGTGKVKFRLAFFKRLFFRLCINLRLQLTDRVGMTKERLTLERVFFNTSGG